MSNSAIYLMYHEIELPGREMCQSEPGYVRYVITEDAFRKQIARLKTSGFRGISVSEAIELSNGQHRYNQRQAVAITFDDGCETDLLVAAPVLEEACFNATFYVIAGRVGLRGYLSRQQLRQLSESGFEIGCHSMTHAYLTDLSIEQLRVEIVEAKDRLEQIIGKRVAHFSCPGGRWTTRTASIAEEAGYDSVATSRAGLNSNATDPFRLARVAVMRNASINEFDRLCRGNGFILRRARQSVLSVAKGVLGNSVYEKVRASVLGA